MTAIDLMTFFHASPVSRDVRPTRPRAPEQELPLRAVQTLAEVDALTPAEIERSILVVPLFARDDDLMDFASALSLRKLRARLICVADVPRPDLICREIAAAAPGVEVFFVAPRPANCA